MATSNINFAAPPAAATAPSAGAAGASATASGASDAKASGSSGGLSFNDLMNKGSGGSDSSGRVNTAASDDGYPDDAGGEDAPPGGNALPLMLPMLPPVTPPVATAAEEVETLPTASPTTAVPMTAAAASDDGAALPDDVLQTLNGSGTSPADDAAVPVPQQNAAQDKPLPEQLRAMADTVPAPKADKAPTAQAVPSADEDATSTLAARLAQGSDQNADSTDDGDLSRRLYSLSLDAGAPKASAHTAPAVQHPAQANTPNPQPTPADMLAAGGRPAEGTAANNAQQLLREFKFERSGESIAPTSSTPTTVHTGGLQPTAATVVPDDVPVTQLQTPVQNSQQWADGLGERIVWMTNNNHQNAQIRLNPAHLGPIEVQVSVSGDQTNVSFTAHHAATREALEAAAPRLRDVLGSQGFGHVNVSVNHQSTGDRLAQNPSQNAWQDYSSSSQGSELAGISDGALSAPARSSTRSLIDAYA